MEKADVVNLFKVGQLAEMKSFEKGYRGAWFRCKIREVMFKKSKIQLEYYDFDEEEISWVKIYELPPYIRRSKSSGKELMLRPPYPPMYHKSEMPPVNSLSEVCVVIDGTWKVGDLVDWFTDSCYWVSKVIKVFSDDKVEVELPMPPVGERKDEEEDDDKLIASFTELRPSLDWSDAKGWTLPTTADGRISSRAELIFPSKQDVLDMDLEVENAPASSPLHASSTSRISAERDTERQSSDPVDTPICVEPVQNSEHVDSPISKEPVQRSDLVDTVIFEEPVQSEDDVKMDDGFMESSNSISSLRVEESKAADEEDKVDIHINKRTDLNIMREDTLEAAVLDLEELVNKVKWIKTILHTGQSPIRTFPKLKTYLFKFLDLIASSNQFSSQHNVCYWSAKVIRVFSDEDKVRVEFPVPPVGEGKDEGEDEDTCIASFTDLRPYLDWSETRGWTLPTTADGRIASSAELIFPSTPDVIDMDLEVENGPPYSPPNDSFTSSCT